VKFQNVVSIERRREEVFAYLADFETIPRWNYAISETRKLTGGPVTTGTRYRQTRTLPSHSIEEFEVVEIQPGRRISVVGDLAFLHGRVTYELSGDGEVTTLTNSMDLAASGPLDLLAKLAAHNVRSAVAANLGVLKRLLERE
jgi:uncharacterized protein YndB with AHSA1/START domain